MTFSGQDGAAVLYLDGNEVGQIDGLGSTQIGTPSHDLSIGSPWGGSFAGLIDNFSFLRGAMDADDVRDAYVASMIYPSTGAHILTGGVSNDIVRGGSGNDTIFGLAGNDQLLAKVGTIHSREAPARTR